MLRKFLISTVIVSILILLTTLTTITAASATTLTSLATTKAAITTKSPSPTTSTITAAASSNISATVFQLTKASVVNKFLNNAAEETTTSLLPLQPPLNVTSTTLASFILNQKHQQQQRLRKQQQQLYLRQQRHQRQLQNIEQTQKQQEQPQVPEYLLNDNVNDNKEIKKKNLDAAFVTLKSPIDVVSPEPNSTHAYIPFDLDYNDPTEEKAAPKTNARQSTINEVLHNLFPKGFSDIFRFSYAGEVDTTSTTAAPITVVRSTPAPFKPMPSSTKFAKHPLIETPQNRTLVTVSTTVTREMRREVRPGHTEIVVEKIVSDPAGPNSGEEFKDGSNSISRDELLRINRAAREASVLPSVLINPSTNSSDNLNLTKSQAAILILNESNNNDDFVDAPEDDNQLAETQDVVNQVIQPPPAESTNFQVGPTHQYNVRIIHNNAITNSQDNAATDQGTATHNAQEKDQPTQEISSGRGSPSYQAFVQQSRYLQNSLQEAPSRKFLKHFQNPILSDSSNPAPINKGNFHYEQANQQNHIQAVAPATSSQYVQYRQEQPQPEKFPTDRDQQQHLSDKDIYQIGFNEQEQEVQQTTPPNLVFVTINTPTAQAPQQPANILQLHQNQQTHMIPAELIKSPHQFVSDAMGYSNHNQQLADHQAEQTESNPKPSDGGYTFVEVQKSINIHNKLITEKDGRLIEQHETIYPDEKYAGQQPEHGHKQEESHSSPDYLSLSQNPIHVEQLEEPYESAASIKNEQFALNTAQGAEQFGPIQQSNLVQESHIIETPQQPQAEHEAYHDQLDQHQAQVHTVAENEQDHQIVEEHQHLTGEILPTKSAPAIQIPYALPAEEAHPVVVQGIVEKHIPVPYGVPEPVGIPVHIQHFIDRPFPVETIVEKPVPYPVEKVVEKIVEKHVPIEVEKIVEKPVEVVVKKYIDRPVAIPIKIPVALHLPSFQHGPPHYGPPGSSYPTTFAGGIDHASTWPQPVSGGAFTQIPQSILKAYYVKMLKKLVPQMQQAYKNANIGKGTPKIAQKPYAKPKYKLSDILYDLKPPPPRPKSGSDWDVGARYQYDYNTLPLDLSGSSSIAVGKSIDRPGQGYKTNSDEFQRWRNGHSLKRSPDFGRNLHVEYGFKPPLVPSVEIDDKGVPLKALADLTKAN